MRLRHKKGAEDLVLKSKYCINIDKKSEHINITNYFNNDKPLYLELGMGKGKFICEMAKNNPNINFIGVEKYATVVLKAIENYKKIYLEIEKSDDSQYINLQYGNLKFLCDDVNNLPKYFQEKSIDKIFLNFSDPWPKKRHEERRLTHRSFLSQYEKLLKENGCIEFKTDNIDLFDFSLEELKHSNFKLIYKTHDLHADKDLSVGNIETEYEHKFSLKGNPICKYKISKK